MTTTMPGIIEVQTRASEGPRRREIEVRLLAEA